MKKFLNLLIVLSFGSQAFAAPLIVSETNARPRTAEEELKKHQIKTEIVELFKATDLVQAKIKLVKKEIQNRLKNDVTFQRVDPTGRNMMEVGKGLGIVSLLAATWTIFERTKLLMSLTAVFLGAAAATYFKGAALKESAESQMAEYAAKVARMSYNDLGHELDALDKEVTLISQKIETAQLELYRL